ncbi:MAG: cupin domain-containing protein [Lachnospiraceae bacterium]|jgi:dTDP-4-dehydrorhamnose 3,5-epimerase-like enzyme|nr:cupin domain-containing protein [Lachnospiraceae bacterium]
MLIHILKPNFVFEDERGSLIQLVRAGYAQVNVITSTADSLRGGHYHKKNEEAFYILDGELRLEVYKLGEREVRESYVFAAKDMFQIPRCVVHSFYFTKPTTLVSMYSNGVELPDGGKDIWTEQ